MMRMLIVAALAGAGLAGCMMDEGAGGSGESAMRQASADLRTAAGAAAGRVTATESGGGLDIRLTAMAMPAGTHGAHVHAVGRCDAPDFTTAGAHWNPTGAQHGRDNPAGAHKGDLPNIDIAADGTGSLSGRIEGATLAGLMDADGGAFLVHASADDYRTDPSGNSGARIACGVFR